MRAEFDTVIKPSKDRTIEDILRQEITLESCNDMAYLGYVIHETLRVNPVVTVGTPHLFEQDVKVGGLLIKAYDDIIINHSPLHRSAKYW